MTTLHPPTGRQAPFLIVTIIFIATGAAPPSERLPSPQEMTTSLTDVWGAAAVRQPGGPSYEFFKDLLPPLRYVNTEFRYYPVVLGPPAGRVKARWVSNGSAINARAKKPPMWREVGFPVHFLVGDKAEPFGEDPDRLNGPVYASGYLPYVEIAYRQGKTTYYQEAFGSVREPLAGCGAVCLRFTARGAAGQLVARLDLAQPPQVNGRAVCDDKGQALVLFEPAWQWDGARKQLTARLEPDRSAVLVVLTQPLARGADATPPAFADERRAFAQTWEALLGRGSHLDIPEPVVQNAWRATVLGNFAIAVGNRMHYSAGNAYDHLYEAECGDATRALLLFGHKDAARGMVGPLLDFNRKDTRYHVAGQKLQLLSHYYWLTRDADYLREKRPVWKAVVDLIVGDRQKSNGLMPPDRYAGDIKQQVYALNSNANCWRGLRDLAAVLADIGEKDLSTQLFAEAKDFRRAILAAVAKSEYRDVRPPFIPNALFGVEKPYDVLPATRFGSYYDLMAPYIIASGVFGPGDERETWMIEYLQQHGGIAMGMIRTTPAQGQFKGQPGINVLYGLRYVQTLLRRDDCDRARTGFYGQLAQAMTRATFIGGEGSRLLLGDRHGRGFYLPPNSASNAMFLTTLRYLLIQDWDLNDDGRPDTLRLLYAAPPRWLKDGAVLNIERAPTMFGDLSLRAESHLSRGAVTVAIDAPPHRPEKTLLRLPLPAGWKAVGAKVGEEEVTLAKDGAVDLTSRGGRYTVRFQVEATRQATGEASVCGGLGCQDSLGNPFEHPICATNSGDAIIGRGAVGAKIAIARRGVASRRE